MAIYCGIDFHPRQHSVCYCDAADGEIHYLELHHERDDLHSFYSQFTGEVIAGMEASGYSAWFEQLLAGLGRQVWLGGAAEIRRRARCRQKNYCRDANLILDLLRKGEFPCLHCPPPESREVLRLLRYRHRSCSLLVQSWCRHSAATARELVRWSAASAQCQSPGGTPSARRPHSVFDVNSSQSRCASAK